MPLDTSHRSFATLTHARVRAGQGDLAGAERVLRAILTAEPGHGEARALLDAIERGHGAIVTRPVPEPGQQDRRAQRLGAWLERVRDRRGERRAG